jgi:hypothetical protein
MSTWRPGTSPPSHVATRLGDFALQGDSYWPVEVQEDIRDWSCVLETGEAGHSGFRMGRLPGPEGRTQVELWSVVVYLPAIEGG